MAKNVLGGRHYPSNNIHICRANGRESPPKWAFVTAAAARSARIIYYGCWPHTASPFSSPTADRMESERETVWQSGEFVVYNLLQSLFLNQHDARTIIRQLWELATETLLNVVHRQRNPNRGRRINNRDNCLQ